jgi:c-di-AMP phosphodiesterase-like protein
MSGIEASFVVTRNPKGQAAISARSKQKINVQRLMEKLGGGGHFNLAACQVNGTSVSQLTRALLQEIAEEIKIEEEN